MKKIYSLVFFLLPILVSAQSIIKGRVVDDTGKPVSYVNIALLRLPDSTLSVSAVTNSKGEYQFSLAQTGVFAIKYTAIGYRTSITTVETKANNENKELSDIVLKSEAKLLNDVSVQALRPTITQLADKMVVSVQGTAMAAGNTAYDVLGRSPGVFIDHEGNIQLNGRSGITVMIDGKQTYLSARDLRNMLEGMSAENIKNIEIITNPSSKYEAEGSSGIININLKKNSQQGINGSVYGSANYNGHDAGGAIGGSINYKSGKWNSYLTADLLKRVGGREGRFTRIFINPSRTTYFDQQAIGNFHAQGPPTFRVGTDYTINEKNSIGGMVYYNTNTAHIDFLTDTWIGNSPNQPQLFIDADNRSVNTFTNFTSNLHYVSKLDTMGSQVSTDLDFIRITNKGYSNFYNFYDSLYNDHDVKDYLYTRTPNAYNIYSARLDYVKMLPHGVKVEAGGRFSKVNSDNDFRFYFNNAGLVPDPLRTNYFKYDEQIHAAYLNMGGNLGKKVSVQGGIRMEKTLSTGNLVTTGQKTKRSYTDFFPSLFIQQKFSDQYNITWSYSRRIQRPNYGNLNPFRSYRDPYTYIEGNPYLRPQYAHSFSLTQTFKKNYILTLSYQLNKDFIAELPKLDVANSTTIYYNGNVDGAYSYGATAIAPLKVMKKWDSQNTLVLSYNYNRIIVDNQALVNDQLYYSFQTFHTVQLPKELRLEMNFLYQGPAAYGLYAIQPRTRFDMAVKKSFMKKKLELAINAVDIFKGQRLKFETHINGNINDFDQYLRARVIGFTVRYNFSKGKQVDTRRRNSGVDEVNRAN